MRRAAGFSLVTPSELRSILDSKPVGEYDLIDVRQPSEYEEGHIPGAKLIPLGEFERRLAELRPDKEQILYCAAGGRSKLAASQAVKSGRFTRPIMALEGGLRAWNGEKVHDYPPLKAFEDAETFHDALMSALELEKGTWLFYEGLLKDPPRDFSCATIQQLADAKKEQARRIYAFLEQIQAGRKTKLQAFNDLFAGLKGDILESGDNVEVLVQWAKASYDDCEQLAELSLDLEYEAYDLYRNMSFDASDKEEEQAFDSLSDQEKRLIQILCDQIDQLRAAERH